MSLDLTIYPIKHAHSKGREEWIAYQRLDFTQDVNLFNAIQSLPSRDLKYHGVGKVVTFDEGGAYRTSLDAYGSGLRVVEANDFNRLWARYSHCDHWNTGIIAFLRAIPSKTPVVLYWH